MTALERAIARPDPVHGFAAQSPLHGLERRTVGFADVLAQSVAAVAPTAAATTVILLVAGASAGSTVLSVALATLLALLVARTVNQFTRRLAASGSLYTYASRGLGPVAGLTTAAAIVVGYAFISVFALLGGAHYLSLLMERLWPGAPGPLVASLAVAAEGAALAVVLIRGIRISARVALVVESVSVALIVALLIALLVHIGPFRAAAVVPAGGISVSALAAGAVLALTAFVGFESSATLGVEARAPLKNIPRAIVWTVLVAGALYLLAAYTQVAGFAAAGRDLVDSESPVDELASLFGLSPWAAAADIGIAASFLACAIASTTALTRVLFAMGRDGVLPARFGRAHARHRTPIGAVVFAVPAIVAAPLVLVACGIRPWDAMGAVIVISAVGYIVAYAVVCVAAPVFLRRIGETTAAAAIVSIGAAIAIIVCLAVYLVVEAQLGNPGVWISGALAVVAGALIAWRVRFGGASLAGAGGYDEPVAAQVLGGVARREG